MNIYDIFRERGNLEKIFIPRDSELTPDTNHIEFEMYDSLFVKIADPVIAEYLRGRLTFDVVQEHVKSEEQKWIRKAKRFLLYDDAPYRMK